MKSFSLFCAFVFNHSFFSMDKTMEQRVTQRNVMLLIYAQRYWVISQTKFNWAFSYLENEFMRKLKRNCASARPYNSEGHYHKDVNTYVIQLKFCSRETNISINEQTNVTTYVEVTMTTKKKLFIRLLQIGSWDSKVISFLLH